MAPPRIPPELVAEIIELTVELLIEEERHLDAHEPLSNRFLRSATLVSREWHPIAVKVLLKCGIVTSGSVVGFLTQVKAHGMEATLKSARFGEASGAVAAESAADEDTAFDLLVESLPGLKQIEFVESGSHFQTALPQGRGASLQIRQLHLSNPDWLKDGFKRKFEHSPPSHLIITDTRSLSDALNPAVDRATALTAFHKLFANVESFRLTTTQPVSVLHLCLMAVVAGQAQPRLRTYHYECTSREAYAQLIKFYKTASAIPRNLNFPHLECFTSHLLFAHYLLVPGTQPSLTSLKILPSPTGAIKYRKLYEAQLLDLVEGLPVLESLKVPVGWASDAVREGCHAKGVVLSLE